MSEGEEVVVSLVRDEPEQLYNHKNQIAAITNKRLLYIKHTGVSRSFEGSYVIESIDLRHVNRVKRVTRFGVGGLVAGIIAVSAAAYILHEGLAGRLVGPGVIFIPAVVIPAGIALVFGLKRRVVVFDTSGGSYKWVSAPFKFSESEQLAASVCEKLTCLREARITELQSSASESYPELLKGYDSEWYHILVAFFLPFIGLPWGIVNLRQRRRHSGLTMTIISGVILALLLYIKIAAVIRHAR